MAKSGWKAQRLDRTPAGRYGLIAIGLLLLLPIPAQGADPQSVSPSAQGEAGLDVQPSPQANGDGHRPDHKHGRTTCGRSFCVGLCRLDLDPERGFFALNQESQYFPPASGWSVIMPPIPGPFLRPDEPDAVEVTPAPWRPLFFDNDFRYLRQEASGYENPFDFLKQIALTPSEDLRLDVGGEFRWQGRWEDNRRLIGERNDFSLFRQRLYADTWFRNFARVYLEYIYADSTPQTVPPLPVEINRGDLLNAFGELRFFRTDDASLSGRAGRQELLYGNQRLVSPLDWVNTRRTFQGYKLLWRSENWAIDGFWINPVPPLADRFDAPDRSRQFFGVYGSYRGLPNQVIEPFYLALLETDPIAEGTPGGPRGTFDAQTLGFRYQGQADSGWILETELAFQFGRQVDLSRSAGMATVGLGKRWNDLWATPELFAFFDYASGDGDPFNDAFGTFNQLFPLAHKYLGYMDIVARQNIIAPNIVFKLYPGKRVNLLVWYHHFELAQARDALYNAAGVPIRRDLSGQAGTNVGDEIDFLVNFIINPNTDFQINYSRFFAGPFVERTGVDRDGEFFYMQFAFRF